MAFCIYVIPCTIFPLVHPFPVALLATILRLTGDTAMMSRCILLDYGTFTSYLTILNTWLIANPNEVVTLLLVNTDTLPATTWAKSFTDSGVINYVYTPPSVPINYAAWPTLGSLISAGTRVVAFLAQNADVESAPYLIDEFTNIWETNFDVSCILSLSSRPQIMLFWFIMREVEVLY